MKVPAIATILLYLVSTVQAYEPTTTQEAWDNHFNAFAAKDVEKILLDYNEKSVAVVYNASSPSEGGVKYTGLTKIKGMFEGLFETLTADASDLTVPNLDVDKEGMVFLAWKYQSLISGRVEVTDTLIFGEDPAKIKYQTIYVNPSVSPSSSVTGRSLLSSYRPANSQEVWDNHFDAFGAQDLSKIMLDYDQNSEVRIFDFAKKGQATYKGTAAIKGMFAALFESLYDTSCLAAPFVHQETDLTFLVWENPCTGYKWVTDTVSYAKNKIRFQNIALETRYNYPRYNGRYTGNRLTSSTTKDWRSKIQFTDLRTGLLLCEENCNREQKCIGFQVSPRKKFCEMKKKSRNAKDIVLYPGSSKKMYVKPGSVGGVSFHSAPFKSNSISSADSSDELSPAPRVTGPMGAWAGASLLLLLPLLY